MTAHVIDVAIIAVAFALLYWLPPRLFMRFLMSGNPREPWPKWKRYVAMAVGYRMHIASIIWLVFYLRWVLS